MPLKATYLLRRREMTRRAMSDKVRRSKLRPYSITSSASDRKDSGIVSPSASD
jgi:hypothetical protein